jgi:predicted DsbA family dithiol-disulfide isomerase
MTVPITVASDFICPWCLIGERRLMAAIASLPEGVSAAIEWLPYELNPDMPAEGMERKTYRTLKFGSWTRSLALDAETVRAASEDGVRFNYAAIGRTPNTFHAHRLSWLAAREDKQQSVVDALFSAYFEQGRDIGDLDTLIAIAGEQGLDRERIAAALRANTGIDEVRRLEAKALQRGLRGVPHFNIGQTVVRGAQSTALLRNTILDEHARRRAA